MWYTINGLFFLLWCVLSILVNITFFCFGAVELAEVGERVSVKCFFFFKVWNVSLSWVCTWHGLIGWRKTLVLRQFRTQCFLLKNHCNWIKKSKAAHRWNKSYSFGKCIISTFFYCIFQIFYIFLTNIDTNASISPIFIQFLDTKWLYDILTPLFHNMQIWLSFNSIVVVW